MSTYIPEEDDDCWDDETSETLEEEFVEPDPYDDDPGAWEELQELLDDHLLLMTL